jgi:hypothetical protein
MIGNDGQQITPLGGAHVVDGQLVAARNFTSTLGSAAEVTLASICNPIPPGARVAIVAVETQAIRYTFDSTTTLTASRGIPLAVGQTAFLTGDLATLKFFPQSIGAVLQIELYA